MSGIDPSKLSVADTRVALVSLSRRVRGAFLRPSDDDDDRPPIDELARRMGPDGSSAADHLARAAGVLSLIDRALSDAVTGSDAPLHPAITDPSERAFRDDEAAVDVVVDRIDTAVTALVEQIDALQPDEWQDRRRVAGEDRDVSLLWLIHEAVSVLSDARAAAIAALTAAEGS